MEEKIKNKLVVFNTITNLFIILSLFSFGLVYSDTNGVFFDIFDMRAGVFGEDEQNSILNDYPNYYKFSFINPVNFTSKTLFQNDNLTEDNIAVISDTKTSGVYSWQKNEEGYSGYFEGGNFFIEGDNINLNANDIVLKPSNNNEVFIDGDLEIDGDLNVNGVIRAKAFYYTR